MTITTILCDLDGTLVDSRRDIAVAFQHAWRTVVGGIPPTSAAIAQHIGKPLAEILAEVEGILSPLGYSVNFPDRNTCRLTYTRQDARLTQPYPGVILTLQALSTFTLGVVTTKESGQAEIVLRRLALIPFFQHIQGGTPGLRLCFARHHTHGPRCITTSAPPHALMVPGDTPADILSWEERRAL